MAVILGKENRQPFVFFPSGSVSVMQRGPTFYLLCYLCPKYVLRSALLWAPADKLGQIWVWSAEPLPV